MIFVRTISYYFSSGDGIDAFFGIAPSDSNNDKIKKVISESEETFRELLKVIGSDGVGKAIVQLSVLFREIFQIIKVKDLKSNRPLMVQLEYNIRE